MSESQDKGIIDKLLTIHAPFELVSVEKGGNPGSIRICVEIGSRWWAPLLIDQDAGDSAPQADTVGIMRRMGEQMGRKFIADVLGAQTAHKLDPEP